MFPTAELAMNAKLLFRTLLLIIVLLLLVMIGLYNKDLVSLSLPPVLPKPFKQPAAIMYFGFFAVGFLVGTLMTAGGGKGASGGDSGKASKGGK